MNLETGTMSTARSSRTEVFRRSLHWLEWGEPGGQPVLALHGWLDNAASFERLGPLLEGLHLVVPDLAGHGLSAHRPAPGSYEIWADLLDLLALADHLGWGQFTLLGHSRGAVIATLLAASAPERIAQIILLDGLLVGRITEADAPTQLTKYLVDQRRPAQTRPTAYESLEQALAARCAAANMSKEAALPIVRRGLIQGENGHWHWRADRQLTLAPALQFTGHQALAFYRALRCPALLILASRGFGARSLQAELWQEVASRMHSVRLCGDHHWHLEASAVEIAAQINAFLIQRRD